MVPVSYHENPDSPVTPALGNLTAAMPVAPAPLDSYWSIIKRNSWKILSFVVLAVALTYGVSSLLTPMYEATATIDIDLRTPSAVIGSDARQYSTLDSDQFMATQIKLLQSDSVLRPVADRYQLLKLEKQDRELATVPAAVAQQAPVVLRKLHLNRPPNTFLLQVSYRSPNPELSAQVANEIANSYVRRTYDLRYQTTEGLSNFMERELDQLRAKMEKSSDKLAAFERELNVADPEQKTAILASRLVQLNNEYAAAEADRLRKEAAFHSVQSGSLDAAQVSTQGESLKKTMDRLDEAQQRFALVKSQYGKNHPEYKKAAAEVQELQWQVDQARQSIGHRVEIEFQQAANRETMLASTVAEVKKDFDALNSRSFEYQTLKRDAESDKKLYDELEQKIKEAGINAGFQNSAIRIADPARPTLKPVSPNMKLNLLLAFCFSLCGGIVLAVVSDERDFTIREPEKAWSSLRLAVVGTLPLVKHGRQTLAIAAAGATEEKKTVAIGKLMYAEAVQALCSTVLLSPRGQQLRSVAVTSALPGEGKTLTACHLAAANARRGQKTLLIDCDLRRPSVHRCFGIEQTRGFEEVLCGTADWRELRHKVEGVPDLDVVPVGTGPAPVSKVMRDSLRNILASAEREYDLVIIDSPPILGFSEPLEIAAAADGVLLLAVAGETDSRVLRNCLRALRQVGVTSPGLVLNKVTAAGSEYSYYSKYNRYYRQYLRSKTA